MARRRLIVLPERTTQQPIEIPKSLQKKKTIKNIDSVIEECKKITEKYAGRYICIDDKDVLIDYIDHILANKRAGLDTETTGLDIFNDKVIGFSLFTPGMKACYVPMLHISRFTGQVDPHQLTVEFCAQQLQRLRIPKMELDYFNAPFDMNMIMYMAFRKMNHFLKRLKQLQRQDRSSKLLKECVLHLWDRVRPGVWQVPRICLQKNGSSRVNLV